MTIIRYSAGLKDEECDMDEFSTVSTGSPDTDDSESFYVSSHHTQTSVHETDFRLIGIEQDRIKKPNYSRSFFHRYLPHIMLAAGFVSMAVACLIFAFSQGTRQSSHLLGSANYEAVPDPPFYLQDLCAEEVGHPIKEVSTFRCSSSSSFFKQLEHGLALCEQACSPSVCCFAEPGCYNYGDNHHTCEAYRSACSVLGSKFGDAN